MHTTDSRVYSSQQSGTYPHLQQENNTHFSSSEDAPPPLPQRRNHLNPLSPTSPTLVVTHASPFSSPRTSSRSSPRSSPWNSPRTSPRSSPFASPNVSPHSSPHASPCGSPQNSPAQLRKGRPPPPPVNSDEDSPPAVPERRYKHRGGSLENKENKHGSAGAKRGSDKRDTLGYADIDAANVVHESYSTQQSNKTNYAQLAYPQPNSPEAEDREESRAGEGMFAEICPNEEATSYDFPLPILSDRGRARNNKTVKENSLEDGMNNLQSVADPFADDPFTTVGKSNVSHFDDDFAKGPLVVALPPPVRSQSYHSGAPRRPHVNKDKNPPPVRTFTKARSTDDVLDDASYASVQRNSNRTAVQDSDFESDRNSTSNIHHNRTSRPALISRNSWAGAEAKSFSNPTYGAEGFDPSKLEAQDDHHRRPHTRHPDQDPNLDNMQFYEEDFTILQAQGYTREEITRALIVADNNFAMARKILREFSQGTRKL